MKFKVGDRVKFIKSIIYHTKAVKLGGIYMVKTIDKNKQYLVSCENKNGEFFEEEELALAEYTYEDLKKSPIGTKITFENGKVLIRNDKDYFENLSCGRNISDLVNLKDNYSILGKIIKIEEPEYTTVYEREKEILDEAEKRYLRGVIRPFRNRVDTIERVSSSLTKKDYIQIRHKDDEPTNFPYYNKGTMYKGMEINRRYTLEELGL